MSKLATAYDSTYVLRGHEQLISHGGRFKRVFAERDKKQTMIDLRGISTNWFINQLCPSIRLSWLRALEINHTVDSHISFEKTVFASNRRSLLS